MNGHLIEAGLWAAAGLVWWLAPPSWRPVAYLLIGAAVVVAVSGYFTSRRRLKNAKAAVDAAKRKLEELRKNQT